jgi:hypothetical protein
MCEIVNKREKKTYDVALVGLAVEVEHEGLFPDGVSTAVFMGVGLEGLIANFNLRGGDGKRKNGEKKRKRKKIKERQKPTPMQAYLAVRIYSPEKGKGGGVRVAAKRKKEKG